MEIFSLDFWIMLCWFLYLHYMLELENCIILSHVSRNEKVWLRFGKYLICKMESRISLSDNMKRNDSYLHSIFDDNSWFRSTELGVKGMNLKIVVTKKNTLSHNKPFRPVWKHFRFLNVVISGFLVIFWVHATPNSQ